MQNQRLKRDNLEKQVANYDVNLMGFKNANGSLADITKRLTTIKSEKTALEEKYKKA